jgi:hypothetical protein
MRSLTDMAARRAVRRTDPGAARRTVLMVVATVVLAVCLAGGYWYFSWRIGSLQDQLAGSGSDVRQLAEQVEQLGGTPVVQPPPAGEPGEPGATGPPGPSGRPGRDGADGENGKDGRPGPPGTDGQSGATPPCAAEPAQCQGSAGRDGQDGAAGADGVPGAPGADGAPGRDGAPPAGWTWTDDVGRAQSCTRTGGPDTAPVYECTTAPPADTVPPTVPPTVPGAPLLPLPGG